MERDPALGGEEEGWSGSEPHLSDHVAVVKHLEALKYWRTRQDAARDIVAFGKKAVPGLLEALADRNVGTRLYAVDALISIGDQAAEAGLIEALWDDNALVRQAAASGLGMMGTPTALDGLQRLLADKELWVRKDATLALGQIAGREPETVARIVPLLLSRCMDSGIVKQAALEGLYIIGRAAIPALRDGLHAPEWVVRRTAAVALANLGEAAIPTLEQARNSSDTGVKRIAAWALNRVAIF